MKVAVSDPLLAALLDAQNEDGGWPASKPGGSSTEVTALAVMALSTTGDPALGEATAAGRRWLVSRQRADGGWSSSAAVDESSWMTAPAVLALSSGPAGSAALRGGRWLLEREGQGLGWFARAWFWLFARARASDLDTELKGWPWSAGTFSWVEPTAYSLLALKKLGAALPEPRVRWRIEQGERVIYDRVCPGGGWNYGSRRVLGENLAPYADTTALALMAVHDRDRTDAIRQSLRVLEELMKDARSGLALGWAALCFDLYGVSSAPWRHRLREQYSATQFLGRMKPLALALLALNGGAPMFRA
jgi:hypothetical protein